MSHLRFGPRPIRSTYEITRAGFVGVHEPGCLGRPDVLALADAGAAVEEVRLREPGLRGVFFRVAGREIEA